MRISWNSNAPWARTGYGNQTALFVPRLKALGHELAVIAFYGLEGGVLNWNGIPVYPKGHHAYGQDVVGAHSAHFKADISISLIDAWVCEPHMHINNMRWVAWYPVDMEPIPPPVVRKITQAFARIVYSRYAERLTNEAGLDCYYVPHGVDTKIFTPADQADSRKALNIPADRYVVGMVAANKGTPSRKAFQQNLEAFAEFKRRHPDALLYLHTSQGLNGEYQGVNLPELAAFLGLQIGKDVIFCDPYINMLGFPDDHMARLYNSFDVLLAVSMGEGFGIPIVEAQACGTPVITGEWTAMDELTFGGWKVSRADADKFWTPLAAYQFLPRTGAIVEALEDAYRKTTSAVKRRAREGAELYDVDLVTQNCWKPVLLAIADKIVEDQARQKPVVLEAVPA